MNTSQMPGSLTIAPARRAPALGLVLIVAVFCIGLTGCFRVSSDLRAMRDGVMKSAPGEWDEQIEIGVGALTLTLARTGLGFLELPPEARCALDAARSGEVGVYRLVERDGPVNRAAMLKAADKAMLTAGWDRLLGVVNDRECIAVYVPEKMRSMRNVHVCVAVFDGQQLVVASARSNLEPLLDLALKHVGTNQANGLAFQL